MSADAERTGVRYQDVLDSLRVSYDGRAAWRDQHSLRTDEQIRGFATRCFSVFDFHVIEPGQLHFQSLTMRRPA